MYKETLKQFIFDLRNTGHMLATTRAMANVLNDTFSTKDMEIEIEITEEEGSKGYGPDAMYTYSWDIKGIHIPNEEKTGKEIFSKYFGFQSRPTNPYFANTKNGFEICYER